MLFTALFSVSPFARGSSRASCPGRHASRPHALEPAGLRPMTRHAVLRVSCVMMDVGRVRRAAGGVRWTAPPRARPCQAANARRRGTNEIEAGVQFTHQRDTVYPGVQGAYYWTEVTSPTHIPPHCWVAPRFAACRKQTRGRSSSTAHRCTRARAVREKKEKTSPRPRANGLADGNSSASLARAHTHTCTYTYTHTRAVPGHPDMH
jgi:hypothetical protein